jgi:hypothetical protein
MSNNSSSSNDSLFEVDLKSREERLKKFLDPENDHYKGEKGESRKFIAEPIIKLK